MSNADRREIEAIDGLVCQREPLRNIEQVMAPTLRGIAAMLRSEGRDALGRRIDELARRIATTCRDTRLLVEQLDTITDPRLEETDPRIPAPPTRG